MEAAGMLKTAGRRRPNGHFIYLKNNHPFARIAQALPSVVGQPLELPNL